MKKLITNPKKISLHDKVEYVFLKKYFLNFIDSDVKKKINYSIFSKTNFEINDEIKQSKLNREMHSDILKELFPYLNKVNKINWQFESWEFFLGKWLHMYIAIITNRINLVKPLINSEVNYEEQIKIGSDASLISNDIRDFSTKAGLLEWNEKLLSRIIYIYQTKKFNHTPSFLNSKNNKITKNENFLNKISYTLKINFIKFFERIICFKNNYIFYNSYIGNKLKLFKIILRLGDIPFLYSFSFFDNKIIKKTLNISKRDEIKIKFESDSFDIKVLKFLLIELLPTIYLEGFIFQKKLADSSHLPKKIKKVFISNAHPDNSFKFWLADKINSGTKLLHGQHGAGYNIFKEFAATYHELSISKKYFSWGWKVDKKIIPVGNYLLHGNKVKFSSNKKILIVLPSAYLFTRNAEINYNDSFSEDIIEFQSFIDNTDKRLFNNIDIRPHPQTKRRELNFLNFISFDRQQIKVLSSNIKFDKLIKNYGLTIFNYLSTEFFKMLTLNAPCLLILNKKVFDECVMDEVKSDFKKLSEIGIFHTNGISLAKQINFASNNFENWWNNENSIKIKNEFCEKYSRLDFNIELFIEEVKKS